LCDKSFTSTPLRVVVSCGISSRFRLLSPSQRQIAHALLTRPLLSTPHITAQSTPFNLHVLSTPPALVLSQDQTLILKYSQYVSVLSINKLAFARAPFHKLALLYSAVLLFSMFLLRSLSSADFYINKTSPLCQHQLTCIFWYLHTLLQAFKVRSF
jgi:hypothetical protein